MSSGDRGETGATVKAGATTPAPTKPGVATGPNGVALAPQIVAAQAGALAAELAGSPASVGSLDFYRIPPFLLPIYQAAAAQYGVPWQILAAINEVETDYGSDLSVSSAGAVGWMQFMPSTWLQYGVDALDSGSADPYNPVDAIFAAARYLRAAGATTDLRAAILAYNHSGAYLESVLLRAKLISSYPDLAIGTLTSLIDDGTPVTGSQLGLGSETAGSSSSATGGATALRRGSARALSPSAAAAAASAATRNTSSTPRLIEVLSAPKAAAVAVQDGRIVAAGSSRKLGRYVVLRDLYGDTFTYAGLASIARVEQRAPAQTTSGKVRLYLHPGNADAAEAHSAASVGRPTRTASAQSSDHQLSVGSLVKKGTVLGYVRTPLGAEDGHLRFAISPAGDSGTIDPRPILENWMLLEKALHPRGASAGEVLRGATVGDVALLSASELQRDILSDPGISMAACVHREATSGSLDRRAMGVLAFLSRSGLKPTVGTPGCGSGGEEIALTRVNRIAIAGHQGNGSLAEATVRALLTLHGSLAPRRIVSPRRYANAPSAVARSGHGGYIEIVFSPSRRTGRHARSLGGCRRRLAAAGVGRDARRSRVGTADRANWRAAESERAQRAELGLDSRSSFGRHGRGGQRASLAAGLTDPSSARPRGSQGELRLDGRSAMLSGAVFSLRFHMSIKTPARPRGAVPREQATMQMTSKSNQHAIRAAVADAKPCDLAAGRAATARTSVRRVGVARSARLRPNSQACKSARDGGSRPVDGQRRRAADGAVDSRCGAVWRAAKGDRQLAEGRQAPGGGRRARDRRIADRAGAGALAGSGAADAASSRCGRVAAGDPDHLRAAARRFVLGARKLRADHLHATRR